MNRKGQQRKGKEPIPLWAFQPPYNVQISCDITPWVVVVVVLTCPIPPALWEGVCKLGGWGGVYIVRGQGAPTALIPCDFFAGWMQCSGRALVCSAPTLSILFHSCLAYISFPRQRLLKHFFRCLLWRQFLCSIFYDTQVSLYPSPLGQI